MQALLNAIFPNQCPGCAQMIEGDQAICPACWGDTHFITGCCCDSCGIDLPGDTSTRDVLCDECIFDPKPWAAGRAALMYHGGARQMILGLKHGDRYDLVKPLSRWMVRSIKPTLPTDPIFVPIPLHWRRMFYRKFNQSALLATQIGRETKELICLDGLQRIQHTDALDGCSRGERAEKLENTMRAHPGRSDGLVGRHIVLVDDVMTTGATFKEATRALNTINVASVTVLALARVGNAP